ncbi:hypothetical protein LB577_19000 [Mesorhizobium sp. B283B1A]|nr:hypothetical protein [Mesorhizobium sp. B283B1A]
MYNFMSLHAIAARRSDGLRPELIRLFQVRAALKAAGVADLQSYNGAGFEQAGPNPVGDAGAGKIMWSLFLPTEGNSQALRRVRLLKQG